MLALLEPCCLLPHLVDGPHLGCAMLIAACRERGIKTTLIKGQTRYLKDMFVDDSEELWNLIRGLKEDDLKKMGKIGNYKKSIQRKGLKQFRSELKGLYQRVALDKNPRHYYDAKLRSRFNCLHEIFVNLELYYLAEFDHAGLEIIDRYISEIIRSNPRYIGFSLENYFDPLSRTIRKRIKELTGVPIIVGGAQTPFIDFKKIDKIFEEEYFDYLIVGAGDYALPSLIEALEDGRDPKGIMNVFYKKGGRVIDNDLGIIDDLDKLPYPDYSQFDLDLYFAPKRILPLQTARGCSWNKCAFCSHCRIYQDKYRTFSIGKVVETIKHLQNNYKCSHFVFHDEELPPGRAKKISDALLNNNVKNISIFSYARLTSGYHSNVLLGDISKAGFSTINWGLESGSQRVLDSINKGTKIKTMSQILKKSSKNGITNLCFIFFGFPGETKKEAQQTVEFLKKHAAYIDGVFGGIFALDSNSQIGKCPEKWGVDVKKNGSYVAKSGMSFLEAEVFYSELTKKLNLNSIKISSDKLLYIPSGFNARMLHFLNSSYHLLSNTSLLERLKEKKLDTIFPIILGEIKKKHNRTVFYPVKANETVIINQFFPSDRMIFDSLKEKIFVLSDGTLSIGNIVLAICKSFKKRDEKGDIYKKCINFFQKIFLKKLGIGFSKSWQL